MKQIFALVILYGIVSLSITQAQVADELAELVAPATPRVAYYLKPDGKNLLFVVEVAQLKGGQGDPLIRVGLSADRTVFLSNKAAVVSKSGDSTRYRFTVPVQKLVQSTRDWKEVKAAFTLEWGGGPLGKPRLRSRFLHRDSGASHRELSSNPADWETINFIEHESLAEERRQQIRFDFEQPLNGKATVVIEDAVGNRVRNLFSSQPLDKGTHRITWDGLDDNGKLALPGVYRWRSLSHPGLSPVFVADFVNAPGSNHGTFQAATHNGESVFLGTPVSEGGVEVVEYGADRTYRRGFVYPHGHGLAGILIAADKEHLYAIHEGRREGERIDTTKPDWKATNSVTLSRYNLSTRQLIDYPGKVRLLPILTYEVGPGSARQYKGNRAAGLVLHHGTLYLGDAEADELLAINPGSGEILNRLQVKNPVAVSSHGGMLYLIADGKLIQLNPVTGAQQTITSVEGKPAGLAVGPDGRFYISDTKDHVVHVFNPKGKREKSIGTPGGVVTGPYDPYKLHNPHGLAVMGDQLWVTEHDRWTPKRYTVYDTGSGKLVQEFFGPTNYGAQGAGFDPLDHGRWIGQNSLFNVDLATGKATPESVLSLSRFPEFRRHQFWRQEGRVFVISSGKATCIQELLPDKSLKPLAIISSAHTFSYSYNWRPPEVFLDAFTKAYPKAKVTRGAKGEVQRGEPGHGYGMLWVDRNGDGQFQEEEFDFSIAAQNFAGSGWSHDFHDLTLRVPAQVKGRGVTLVTLKPEGWWKGGAPRYPTLNEAIEASVPISLRQASIATAVDRFGNLIANADPEMKAFAPDGKLLWSYPNKWSDVHGSHSAPLPVTGQLQGSLFFSGLAPLDDKADVMFVNGNHGQGFLLSSDGFYIDAVFPDVRTMTNPQASGIGILGGECFGGTFGRSEKDGNYYFQGGGISYRIYRIEGLRQIERKEGTLTVSSSQIVSAERRQARQLAQEAVAVKAQIPWQETAPDAKEKPIVQWHKEGRRFPVSVFASCTSEMLHLRYHVQDESPWVNNGGDWQSLFKTGDGVDLQLSTNSKANPRRINPVPGDLRLFIAPMGNKNVAVLYRHRVPEGKPNESVVFQSPWRSEKVDQVRQLENVAIEVKKSAGSYVVAAAIPLAELGLDLSESLTVRGDFGVIYGDSAGTTNIFRNYWSNQVTGLVNDVPGEIMLNPSLWGEITFNKQSASSK